VGCESVVRRREEMEHVMGSVGQHMEYNMNAILDTQNELWHIRRDLQNTRNRLSVKEQELQRTQRDLLVTKNKIDTREQELENIKRDLQDTKDRLDAKEQAMVDMRKDLQDTRDKLKESQSQLKMAITDKGREMDEVKKNTSKSNRVLQGMVQQLKDRLEGTEQSLQNQLKVNTQLQLQVETIFNSNWSLQLNYLVNSGNKVAPVIIKLTEFEKCKKNETCWHSPGFYTMDEGYKMCLIFSNGSRYGVGDYVTLGVGLMKGDHDYYLKWPVKGTLRVQLLNQLSDSYHSEPVEFYFDGSSKNCHMVEIVARHCVWCYQFMPHKRLNDADKKCQYLKNDCLFFRVCNFL